MTESRKKPIDVEAMFPQVARIGDTALKHAVISVWQELWDLSAWDDVEKVPTAPHMPYPTMPHNRCVLDMALACADALEAHHGVTIDRDVLIAAGILQDAAKVLEYAPDGEGKVGATSIGRLYPHAFWAAHLAVNKGIPEDVVHIIFTHSLISPKFPESLEGQILHYVDTIDVAAIAGHPFAKDVTIRLGG